MEEVICCWSRGAKKKKRLQTGDDLGEMGGFGTADETTPRFAENRRTDCGALPLNREGSGGSRSPSSSARRLSAGPSRGAGRGRGFVAGTPRPIPEVPLASHPPPPASPPDRWRPLSLARERECCRGRRRFSSLFVWEGRKGGGGVQKRGFQRGTFFRLDLGGWARHRGARARAPTGRVARTDAVQPGGHGDE